MTFQILDEGKIQSYEENWVHFVEGGFQSDCEIRRRIMGRPRKGGEAGKHSEVEGRRGK
jgi:hypothetical protein